MEETICKECQTQNPAANAFCTACGHKLEPNLVRDIGDSLQEGYKLVASGKPDQAHMIAAAVLRKQPQESGAYALMAMAYEEKGDVTQAIKCYEEVVRLRPESKIDALKLAQLREMSDRPVVSSFPGKRGVAVALSVGAALLAVAVGLANDSYRRDGTVRSLARAAHGRGASQPARGDGTCSRRGDAAHREGTQHPADEQPGGLVGDCHGPRLSE